MRLETTCDNEGLITRMSDRQTYNEVFANSTLEPDWDITEQIFQTHHELLLPCNTYQWVKGHQDDHRPYHALPIAAQYNIQADELADVYLHTTTAQSRLRSPLLPASKCSLEINKISFQAHYTRAIRHAASVPKLHKYLRRKFQWSKQIISSIDWDTFQLAANNYSTTDNHLLKLVYDQLPTRQHKAKFEPWVSTNCHYCDQEESFQHLLVCDNPISSHFRKQLILDINTTLTKSKAPQGFITAITTALQDWFQDKPILRNAPTITRMHRAIHSQSKIGWKFFLKGFLSTEWTTYLQYDHDRHAKDHQTTIDIPKLLSRLIKCIWQSQSNLWTAHLSNIHDKKNSTRSPDTTHELKTRIRTLHLHKDETLAVHRSEYFHEDLESYLHTATSNQMKSYLLNYGPAIHASIAAAKKWTHTTSILNYAGFHHDRPPPNSSSTRQPSTHVNREAPSHRKHSRWRPSQSVLDNFKTFFSPPKNPP